MKEIMMAFSFFLIFLSATTALAAEGFPCESSVILAPLEYSYGDRTDYDYLTGQYLVYGSGIGFNVVGLQRLNGGFRQHCYSSTIDDQVAEESSSDDTSHHGFVASFAGGYGYDDNINNGTYKESYLGFQIEDELRAFPSSYYSYSVSGMYTYQFSRASRFKVSTQFIDRSNFDENFNDGKILAFSSGIDSFSHNYLFSLTGQFYAKASTRENYYWTGVGVAQLQIKLASFLKMVSMARFGESVLSIKNLPYDNMAGKVGIGLGTIPFSKYFPSLDILGFYGAVLPLQDESFIGGRDISVRVFLRQYIFSGMSLVTSGGLSDLTYDERYFALTRVDYLSDVSINLELRFPFGFRISPSMTMNFNRSTVNRFNYNRREYHVRLEWEY